jgi:uncharacterized delta-60 repeat protein
LSFSVASFARRCAPAIAAVSFSAAVTAGVALAAAGDLDPTFGTGGKVVTNISSRDEIHAVALQGDGKVLGVGWSGVDFSTADFSVARYTKDGALDASYGSGGVAVTDLGGADIGLAAAVQSDGKLLVGGATGQAPDFVGNTALVRYTTSGTLDPTFGSGGVAVNDFGGDEEWSGLAVLKSGKIVASGFTGSSENQDFLLARFNSDGTLDTSFGCASPPCAGWTTTDFGAADQSYAVAVQSDGKIVLSGFTGTTLFTAGDFALARYTANGVLDPSFGSGGKVVTDIGGANAFDNAHGLTVAGSGKIVAAGISRDSGGSNFVVARYVADGSLDPTFGCASPPCNGFVVGPAGAASSVALQKDNRIVAGGLRNNDFALARYTADGVLDSRFGTGGLVTTDIGTSSNDGIEGLAIQPKDGKIVAGGWSNSGSGRDFAVARYSG